MKKTFLIALIFLLIINIFGCSKNKVEISKEVSSFSYENDFNTYSKETSGVATSGFRNTSQSKIATKEEAIKLAKNEVTVKYNRINVSYDEKTSVWMVNFSTKDTDGGDQSIYLSDKGITKLIVNGE